ncbi:MAG: hypothetical protein WEA61_02175 [Anaerolineales bacterium]
MALTKEGRTAVRPYALLLSSRANRGKRLTSKMPQSAKTGLKAAGWPRRF